MSTWYAWLYHYGLGGAFALFCLWLMVRQRAIRLDASQDRRLLIGLAGGLFLFTTMHAAWIWLVTA